MDETLLRYINQEFVQDGEHDLSAEQDLLTSGVIDSLGVMRLVSFIETEYSISVLPKDVTIENFLNVNCIVAYIESAQRSSVH